MLLANATYRVRPWRNGQGVTRDIAADDGWQLSLADITRSGRFSDFGDSVRHFAIVAGAVILRFAGGRAVAAGGIRKADALVARVAPTTSVPE